VTERIELPAEPAKVRVFPLILKEFKPLTERESLELRPEDPGVTVPKFGKKAHCTAVT
jgi:hypothetical protein